MSKPIDAQRDFMTSPGGHWLPMAVLGHSCGRAFPKLLKTKTQAGQLWLHSFVRNAVDILAKFTLEAHYDACWFNSLIKPNMNELVKLRQQITEMEKQAAELKKKNRPAVLAELREQMAAYRITAEELSRPAPKARPKATPAKSASPAKGKKPVVSSPAKYRGPEGQQWTGRGTAPKWLNDLVAGGKAREDFLIAPDSAASGSAVAE